MFIVKKPFLHSFKYVNSFQHDYFFKFDNIKFKVNSNSIFKIDTNLFLINKNRIILFFNKRNKLNNFGLFNIGSNYRRLLTDPHFKQRRKFFNQTNRVNFWFRVNQSHFTIYKLSHVFNLARFRQFKRWFLWRSFSSKETIDFLLFIRSRRDLRPYKIQGYFYLRLFKKRLFSLRAGKIWRR